MLIRTLGGSMADQCDAESKRASRVRSRSQRPEEQSMRPVHRPFRTKATDEASKPDCSFSNVAARTPAWQCAPDCGRTCRQRHASRSIVSILEALAATVARRLQRRACDRHQGGRALCPCKNFGWNQPGHARLAGNGSMSRFYPAEREVVKASKCEFPIGKRTLGRHSTVQPAKAPARSIALRVRPSGHPLLGGPPSVADIHQICTSASLREPATAPYALSASPRGPWLHNSPRQVCNLSRPDHLVELAPVASSSHAQPVARSAGGALVHPSEEPWMRPLVLCAPAARLQLILTRHSSRPSEVGIGSSPMLSTMRPASSGGSSSMW